jgi:putative aldouronate transport system permease protein
MSNNAIREKTSEKVFNVLNVIIMILLCAVTLYPFLNVLAHAFNDGADSARGGITIFPRVFTLENFQTVLKNRDLKRAGLITVSRTLLGTFLSLTVTALAAYALTKKDLIGRSAILIFFTIPMFIGGTLVSSFIIMHALGLLNNFLVYIIPGAFNFFNMIVMRTYFYTIPPSLEESAKIDGASDFRIFVQIMLPLSLPMLAALALFVGVGHWNDFFTNLLFIYDQKLNTLQFILMRIVREQNMMNFLEDLRHYKPGRTGQKFRQMTPESIRNATIVVTVFPIIVIYPFLQKYFIKGMMIGAVKE